MTPTEIQEKLSDQVADLKYRRSALEQERDDLDKAKLDLEAALDARKHLQIIAEAVQRRAHERIAGIVSRCLSAIFEQPYEFKILFEQKRGKTEARLVFERDGMELDPMTASGGGVVDVAAFALRLSCLLLARPPLRRVVLCDEPFRFVSVEYRERISDLLEELAKELNIQFIIVTHMPELTAGKIIKL